VRPVEVRYSSLPNETWYCLTKGYCVEEEPNECLTYLRYFLGHDPVIDMGKHSVSAKQFSDNKDLMGKYNKWLSKNKKQLDEIETIPHIKEVESQSISADVTDYIKSRGWYKSNSNIEKCITGYKMEMLLYLSNLNYIMSWLDY